MTTRSRTSHYERSILLQLRVVADQALSRSAGAPIIDGNDVRLLKDAEENYPAWLQAIASARHYVHFESYIIHEDDLGRQFSAALIAKAQDGVRVRLIYDWMGGFGKTSRRFWRDLRNGGVEVRCYNPPRLDSPLGWLSRDHRKMLCVDGSVGFIAGLCVGRMWVGDPEQNIPPWRDTGVEIRGAAVPEIDRAFSRIWGLIGEPLPDDEIAETCPPAGDMRIRVVATEPATAGMLRLDQLVAAIARKRLWLTDAYFAGTTSYVHALRAAAKDGVDVRLLVPNGTDIPLLRPLSRAGYRPLLEAGVRVFEWNGSMLHAKTAVADGHWSRVGSTNLNIASWFGNCELDAVVEDDSFAAEMEQMYLQDLNNAVEVVLRGNSKVYRPENPEQLPGKMHSPGGSAGRAAAGAVRIGHTLGAAFTNHRVLGPVEARLAGVGSLVMGAFAALFALFPAAMGYPVALLFAWGALILLYRAWRLRHDNERTSVNADSPVRGESDSRVPPSR